MPMAGITFRNMYFLTPAFDRESIHCHELVHAIQWRVLGFDDFLLTYAAGVLQHGYADSPLEAEAYQCQARFERREPLPDLMRDWHPAPLRIASLHIRRFDHDGARHPPSHTSLLISHEQSDVAVTHALRQDGEVGQRAGVSDLG